jgi:hypothetical protein
MHKIIRGGFDLCSTLKINNKPTKRTLLPLKIKQANLKNNGLALFYVFKLYILQFV